MSECEVGSPLTRPPRSTPPINRLFLLVMESSHIARDRFKPEQVRTSHPYAPRSGDQARPFITFDLFVVQLYDLNYASN